MFLIIITNLTDPVKLSGLRYCSPKVQYRKVT